MGLNRSFGTDPAAEKEGAWFEFDDETRVKLRRAGGGNKEYDKLHSKLMEPHMRRLRMTKGLKIPPGLEEPLRQIQRTCYARTVIVDWQTKIDGEWWSGIEPYEVDEEGRPRPVEFEGKDALLRCTEANMVTLLKDYPEAFNMILELCGEAEGFRTDLEEAVEGNSLKS